jgi:hypothetical protein
LPSPPSFSLSLSVSSFAGEGCGMVVKIWPQPASTRPTQGQEGWMKPRAHNTVPWYVSDALGWGKTSHRGGPCLGGGHRESQDHR